MDWSPEERLAALQFVNQMHKKTTSLQQMSMSIYLLPDH